MRRSRRLSFSGPLLRRWLGSSGRRERAQQHLYPVYRAGPNLQPGGPGPSWSEDHRQGQRSSITSRAPPPQRSRISVSVKELCELMNVNYDRAVIEAIARVNNEEEDSLESDSSQTAANEGRYNVDGSMEFKLLHSDNWQPFTSPSLRKTCVIVAQLYTSSPKIKALKFKHLQELKHVLPKDFHPFYNALDHE
ncbi:hypothetical protein DPX16_3280 [Anabarilius grahami]|uniref:Uncharacterized protein n=1 Tax=Anabarilius grahami TaxID=495550 RepID=A0A3N0XPU0_ANAGA|nr:hypothetical protein DPX16_3280 [Anabarilius grahami]